MVLISQLKKSKSISIFIVLFLIICNGCVQSPEQRYQKGAEYFKKQMWDKAIIEFNKALKLNPANAKIYLVLGNTYSQKGLYDEAISNYNKAIEINPNYVEAYAFRGDTYGQKGLYDRAISDCNKAIEINSNYGGAYIMRAFAYYHTEKYDKALEDINKAESLGEQIPSFFDKILQKIQELPKTENENKTSGKEAWQIPVSFSSIFFDTNGKSSAIINGKVIFEGDSIGDIKLEKVNKDSVDIVANGQRRNVKVGQSEGVSTKITGEGQKQAASDGNLGKGISSSNGSAEAFKDQGDTYLSQGNFDQAVTAFSKAIESSPNDGEAYAGRAMVYFEKREYNKARKDAYKAKELEYELTPLFFENLDKEAGR